MAGDAPDFSGGVRFLDLDRMRNYVRCAPYARYLERAIADVSGS